MGHGGSPGIVCGSNTWVLRVTMLADMVAAAIVENRGLPWVAVVPSGTGRWATWLLRKGTKSCTTAGRRCYFSFVREQADGVLSSAAVPRAGLWPATPPLCRCAEYTADQLLRKRLAIYRVAPNIPACSFCEVGGDQLMCPNQTSTQPWRLVCTAQRHKGATVFKVKLFLNDFNVCDPVHK